MLKNVFKMIFESWKIFKNFEKKSENFQKNSKISKKSEFFSTFFLSFKFRHHFLGVSNGILRHSPGQISNIPANQAA